MGKRLLLLLVILTILILYYFNLFIFLENKLIDLLQLFRYVFAPTQVSEIINIKVDDDALSQLGQWPLPRGVYARVIRMLEDEGVKAIGVDIIFAESRDIFEDNKLAEALSRYHNIVLPVEFNLKMIRGINYQEIEVIDIRKPILLYSEQVFLGHINFIPGRDGIIRQLPLYFKTGEEFPAFSYQLASRAGTGVAELKEKNLWLNFIGPPGTVPYISLLDLLAGNYLPGFFENKIVLLGTDISGLGDRYMTPFSRYGYMSGVELHGQALYNIIHRNFLRQLPGRLNLLIILLILLALTEVILNYPPRISGKMVGFILFIYIVFSIYLFYSYNYILPYVTPVIAGAVLFTISLLYWYRSSERERRRIINIFGRYISDDVMQQLITRKSALELGGERIELSVFLLDIRGFTAYAENESTEIVVRELNATFELLTAVIFQHKGTLDKYLGDGLMAVFGAPLSLPEHREQSLKAALKIRELVLPFKIGIAINTGPVVVGNLGTERRMEYTAIGDTVNKAFRFVEIAGPGEIIIGEETYRGLNSKLKKMNWREERVELKGSKQPSCLYRLSEGEEKR